MLTPPRHRVDAPGIYVHETDPAVRLDIVDLESAAIAELVAAAAPERRADLAKQYRHPWRRYASGEGASTSTPATHSHWSEARSSSGPPGVPRRRRDALPPAPARPRGPRRDRRAPRQ